MPRPFLLRAVFVALLGTLVAFMALFEKAAEETTAWWSPLASCPNSRVEVVTRILGERGIRMRLFGSRSTSIEVPFEQRLRAVALMKTCPYAKEIGLIEVSGGPRSTAPRYPLSDPRAMDWGMAGSFKAGDIDPQEVSVLLTGRNIDCAIMKTPWNESCWIQVPAAALPVALELLRVSRYSGGLSFP